MMKSSIRHANIGLAVGIAITVAGVFVFKGTSESAMQATAMAGFIVALTVLFLLDERAERKREKGPQ